MASLADSISKVTQLHPGRKKRSERGDFVKWAEFEPFYNQLRTATGTATQTDMAKAIGYNGSCFSTWKNDDIVPIVAFNSIRWVLHEMKLPAPPKPEPKGVAFDFEELAVLFSAVRDMPVHEVARKPLLGKIAKGLA